MKQFFVILFSLLFSFGLFAQSASLKDAEEAYNNGNFKESITQFENTIASEGFSDQIYYNLGNAYFKDKNYPTAILNYERALRVNPNFTDAKFNLQIAQQHIVDKIDVIDHFFLTKAYNFFVDILSSNGWAICGIAFFIGFLVLIFVFLFSDKSSVRKIGFFGGLFLLLLSIFSNIAAYKQKKDLETHDYAVIFTPSVTVKSSPAESGTELFVIHEGTKVKVRENLGTWSEIELADGNVGWMPTSGLEII